jgi:putative transposase
VLKAKVHVANVIDQEGIKELLDGAKELFPRLSHLWLDAGYRGEEKGRGWVEKVLGWRVWTSSNVRANLLQRKF